MASSRWTRHIKDKEKKKEFEERVSKLTDVWEVFKLILEEDLNALEKESVKKDHYFMPAWSEYQADMNGSKRTIRKILELIP